jgi:hypothetical protein
MMAYPDGVDGLSKAMMNGSNSEIKGLVAYPSLPVSLPYRHLPCNTSRKMMSSNIHSNQQQYSNSDRSKKFAVQSRILP